MTTKPRKPASKPRKAPPVDPLLGNPILDGPRMSRTDLPPGKPGPKGYEPDHMIRAKVSLWSSMGITQEVICDLVGISMPTLHKYFSVELKDGGSLALGKVASTIFDRACAGDTSCMIFYLKTRGQWREKASVGDADNPLVIEGKSYDPADIAVALARKLREERPGEATVQ